MYCAIEGEWPGVRVIELWVDLGQLDGMWKV